MISLLKDWTKYWRIPMNENGFDEDNSGFIEVKVPSSPLTLYKVRKIIEKGNVKLILCGGRITNKAKGLMDRNNVDYREYVADSIERLKKEREKERE